MKWRRMVWPGACDRPPTKRGRATGLTDFPNAYPADTARYRLLRQLFPGVATDAVEKGVFATRWTTIGPKAGAMSAPRRVFFKLIDEFKQPTEGQMTSARLKLLGAGVAAMMCATALAPASANAGCRSLVQATADGSIKYATELVSRMRWRSEVRERYGSGFIFWSKAEQKTTHCTKGEPGDKWHCVARARPCD